MVLQEIVEPKALVAICEELNSSTIQRIADVRDNSRNWQYCMLDSDLGFLYDKSNKCTAPSLVPDPACEVNVLNRVAGITAELDSLNEARYKEVQALVATFSINARFSITLVNVRLPDELSYEDATGIVREVMLHENPFVVLGDFSNVSAQSMEQRKELGGLQAIMPLGSNTGYSGAKSKCSDNILVNGFVQKQLTGNWGLVKEGLTHLAIPNGWTWGGASSAHCPLWIEIYANEPPL